MGGGHLALSGDPEGAAIALVATRRASAGTVADLWFGRNRLFGRGAASQHPAEAVQQFRGWGPPSSRRPIGIWFGRTRAQL